MIEREMNEHLNAAPSAALRKPNGHDVKGAQPPVRVYCVDDNQLLAESVERRIAFERRFKWVGWAGDAVNLVQRVTAAQADVVLVDVDMPDVDAFDLVRALAEACPPLRAVIFSGYVRRDLIDRAVEAGAWGYLSKVASIEEVLDAIEQVARGEFVLSEDALREQRRT